MYSQNLKSSKVRSESCMAAQRTQSRKHGAVFGRLVPFPWDSVTNDKSFQVATSLGLDASGW